MSVGKCFGTIFLIIGIAAASAVVDSASAAEKKLTYEQAWAHCKALMDKDKTYGTTLQGNERFLRGGACMKHFGYNL
ncbi:MAG: hypothetical protein WBF24_02220 [Xanthobacteraceae bacterium]